MKQSHSTLDVEAAIGLMQAISRAAVADDPRRRALVALAEIVRLLDADMATAAESYIDPSTGQTHFQEMLLYGPATDHRRDEILKYLARSHESDPFYAAFGRAAAQAVQTDPDTQIVIHRREDLLANADWYPTEHYRTTRTKIGVDAAMYAGLRTRFRGVWVGAGFHRSQGRPLFTKADLALARCFLLGARPIFDSFASTPKGAGPFLATLTPRQREITYAVLEGLSAKEISSRLGLTLASAQTSVKRLYQRLKISGRGELLRLCHEKGVTLDAPTGALADTKSQRP